MQVVLDLHCFVSSCNSVGGALQPVKVLTPEEKATARWAAFLAEPDAWLDQRAAKVGPL